MITIKQVEKDERLALTTIKRVIKKYPMALSLSTTLILTFIIICMHIMLFLAAVGGGYLETTVHNQFVAGIISCQSYNAVMFTMNILGGLYNLMLIILDFAVGGIILFWLYILFKEYLIYKRDNL
jgi:hypothetical protein